MKTAKLLISIFGFIIYSYTGFSQNKSVVDVNKNYQDTSTPPPRDTTYIDTEGVVTKYHYVEDSFLSEGNGNQSTIVFFYEMYYPNGILKEKGIQGRYNNGMGTAIGTTYQYDSLGKLTETVEHHTASFNKAFILLTEYYSNGVPKSVKKYRNYDQYEIDVIPIGLSRFYDTNGILIKTELYNNDGNLIKTKYYSKKPSNNTINKIDDYRSYFYNTALQSKNIKNYIKTIVKENKRINNIEFDGNSGILHYYVTASSIEPENDFYFLSKIFEFDWTYYLYHDIYRASFYFKSVNGVSVYDITNKREITYLPAKSDVLFKIENNILYRNLYKEHLDYNTLYLDCMSGYDDCPVNIDSLRKKLDCKYK